MGSFVLAGRLRTLRKDGVMKWLLVDGFNLAFRSHFGMERIGLRRPDGFPTGALHGWVRTLWSLEDSETPDRTVVFFDLGGSDRHLAALPDYKAQRDETPADLDLQIPEIKRLTTLMGYRSVEQHGVEADDLLASAARSLAQANHEVVIVSADKDFGQCVGGPITQLVPPPTANPALGWRRLDPAAVKEKFGVSPDHIPDYLALVGDTSDNIPGLRGVGPKTAAKWIAEYGNLEAVLAAADRLEPARFREQVVAEANRIRINLGLVRFKDDYVFDVEARAKAADDQLEAFLVSMDMHASAKAAKRRAAERAAKAQGELF